MALHTNHYLVQIVGVFCFLFSIFQIFSPMVTFYNETVFFPPCFFFFFFKRRKIQDEYILAPIK